MTKAVGFCEELGRNIPLEEAHIEFFKQPEEKRKRFRFQCGDPICRKELRPLIVAALYDRTDAFGEKFKSPYFREHAKYPHIKSCTWISAEGVKRTNAVVKVARENKQSSSVVNSLGLIFKITPRKKASASIQEESIQQSEKNDEASKGSKTKFEHEPGSHHRPTTCRFMTQVAINYLYLTDHARKSTPLEIEGIRKGTFYDICIPVKGFHPFYQKSSIYRGKISVVELTHVFLVKFHSKISVAGDKTKRSTLAEIKITKAWLNENDRALNETLLEIIETNSEAWCFFYTVLPIEMAKQVARFQIDNPDLIAIIPEWDIANEPENLDG